MIELIEADDESHYRQAAILFTEYAEWLGIDLGFQNFESELSGLPKMYGGAKSRIILAIKDHEFCGCIAVRPIDQKTAELKRMYVRPQFQHAGIGSKLLSEAIGFATRKDYKKIRLDTLSSMMPAMNLYGKFGFYEIPAYYHNPQPTAVFFEKLL